MRLLRVITTLFLLSAPLNTDLCIAQRVPNGPPPRTRTPQQIILLFAGEASRDKILLTLNNNRPDSLTTALNLYALDGRVIQLPAITLDAAESRLIDFQKTLQAAGITEPLGYLELDYSGQLAELGSQLTLYPVSNSGGLDSPRSLSADFVATDRHAIAWLPRGSKAVVALTNTTASPIEAKVELQHHTHMIEMLPNQTVLREVESDGQPENSGLLLCDISYSGPVDAVRAFGYIREDIIGSLPLRFYDAQASTMSSISAVGLDTSRVTHVAVRNLSDMPVVITPQLRQVGATDPQTASGTPIVLTPRAATTIPLEPMLDQLRAAGISKGTLTLRSQAAIGVLIGSATQVVGGGLLEDIPLRTSNPPRYMRGFYPLRWDSDYTNDPMISNVTDKPMAVQAFVKSGGVTYVFPTQTVQPGGTVEYDVDDRRKNQVPDISGVKLPLSAQFGKFHWLPMMPVKTPGLIGRTELLSTNEKRASSFSCGGDCSPYNSAQGPYWYSDIGGMYPGPFITAARISDWYELDYDEWGNAYQYPEGGGWVSNNLSSEADPIMSLAWSDQPRGNQMNTGNPGATALDYYFYNYQGVVYQDGSCELTDEGTTYPISVAVPPSISYSGLKDLALGNGTQGSITSNQVVAAGSPSGGTYSWTSSNSNVTLSNTSSATVTTTAASAGSSVLTVTYTLDGESVSASGTINVFQPSSVAIVSDSGVSATNVCFSGANQYNGPARTVTYQIQANQGGTTVPVTADVSLSEAFTVLSSPPPSCGSPPTATQGLVSHQTFNDNFNYCSTSCLPVQNNVPQGSCTLALRHVWTANGFSIFDHTLTYTCTNITPQ